MHLPEGKGKERGANAAHATLAPRVTARED